MLNKRMLLGRQELSLNPNDPAQYFEFVVSKSGTGVNFFGESSIPDDTYYEVNGIQQNWSINNLTFSENDVIKIVYGTAVYSTFNCSSKDYLRLIKQGRIPKVSNTDFENCFYYCTNLTSIPEGLFDNNTQVTNFNYCFAGCRSLTSIPEGLFDSNTQVTSFNYCFSNCINLTSIPEGLFDNNTQATDFSGCFYICSNLTSIPEGLFDKNTQATDFGSCFNNCTSLTSIPEGLFDKNTQVTNFKSCFYYCSSLTPVVKIGSTSTSEISTSYFGRGTASKGTVYCRAGSAAYTAFSSSTNANVNVLTY